MPRKYDFKKIEKKWQKKWLADDTYEPEGLRPAPKGRGTPRSARRPFYNLMMFPYPSAEGLHVGNMYAFTGTDIYGRLKRMQGHDVLEPIGLDGFGIHSENYALKIGAHPMKQAKVSEKRFYKQLEAIGNGFAWKERLETYDPEYYHWTQWLFIQMFKRGLAYRKKQPVNWCPSCKTVLADEQVISGKCERCGTQVVKKDLEQWFFRITKYADKLLQNLEKLDWSEKVKIAQRNWIGRSEGAEIDFNVKISTKPNFLILHGYTGRNNKNFIPWLKKELERKGFKVQAPQMPNTDAPKEEEQVGYVLKNCRIDERTVIVGHSLGGVVAMKVVQKLNRPVAGLVLVAPAVDPRFRTGSARPFWKTFNFAYAYKKIKKLSGFRIVLSDVLESGRRRPYLEYLSEKLSAPLYESRAEREHFCANQEPFILENLLPAIKVFTTRPDTLFGATYMVLAPEHALIESLGARIKNLAEVKRYVARAKKKTEEERLEEGKEKTGVELKGVTAVNPATKKEIPVWVADYVLSSYGTGAIMAVPAHDKRDFEFAKRYKLPVKQVIEPVFVQTTEPGAVREGEPFVEREAITAIVKHWKEDKYIGLKWKKVDWDTLITGGVEQGQTPEEAAIAEIREETGYLNPVLKRTLPRTHAKFFHVPKNQNRFAHFHVLYFELKNGDQEEISEEERGNHEVIWLTRQEMEKFRLPESHRFSWNARLGEGQLHSGEGVLINSGQFDGKDSEVAKWAITEAVGGRRQVQFRLRDWLISRQRYWGAPIPMVHCDSCAAKGKGERKEMPGWYSAPENKLPVKLPFVKDFRPKGKGESPLASVKSFYETKCPVCGGKARRETDVADTFLDSAWYYLRYPSIKEKNRPWNPAVNKKWLPVNMYIGGAEHSVLHLLYVRFMALALHDMKLLDFGDSPAPKGEPFPKFRAHGLLIKEGAKMSKSKGNVVNPDEYVKRFGADTLRMYLMFLAPFEQGGDFRDAGVLGISRFLERVWKFAEQVSSTGKTGPEAEKILHRAIRKVGEDIENLRYNTAISAMMIALNEMERSNGVVAEQWRRFLQLLAPFAPHMTEELWAQAGGRSSIHLSVWPSYEEKMLRSDTFRLVIQVNGKVRDSMEVETGLSEGGAREAALKSEKVRSALGGQAPKRVIYVPGRLINLVV